MSGLWRVLGLVEAARVVRDIHDLFSTCRGESEVSAPDMGCVSLLIQCPKGHQGIANRWCVEHIIESEYGLVSIDRGFDDQHSHTDSGELVLICCIEVEGQGQWCKRNEVSLVQADVLQYTRVV